MFRFIQGIIYPILFVVLVSIHLLIAFNVLRIAHFDHGVETFVEGFVVLYCVKHGIGTDVHFNLR